MYCKKKNNKFLPYMLKRDIFVTSLISFCIIDEKKKIISKFERKRMTN